MIALIAGRMAELGYEELGGGRCGSPQGLRILAIGPVNIASFLVTRLTKRDELLAIDTDAHRCEALTEHCDEVIRGSFLHLTPEAGKEADLIVMSAPVIEEGAYTAHAFRSWLAAGGVLVATVGRSFQPDLGGDPAWVGFHNLAGARVMIAKKG